MGSFRPFSLSRRRFSWASSRAKGVSMSSATDESTMLTVSRETSDSLVNENNLPRLIDGETNLRPWHPATPAYWSA
ncbi:hypothetical protein ACFFX0_17160 [Citricoccus parietis]|uniref:Uncharacterized protein n=1 Tax=Citricoccus parietis TaxID=592307 RepID=A0ABV5G1M6_9MICC